MQNLPRLQEDRPFKTRSEQMFRDMQNQMDQDFISGFGRPFRSMQPPTWFKTTDNFPESDFFSLRPHPQPGFTNNNLEPSLSSMQMEVLDPHTTNTLFVEDPETKSRLFQMSFDVKDYDPQAIQVKVENGCLVVEAKQNEIKNGGTKLNKEFCRKIQLPNDVDPEKLTSSLSADGVLSVKAPVPPKYAALTSPQSHFQQSHHQQMPQFSTQQPQQPMSQFSPQQQPQFSTQQPLFTTTFRASPVFQPTSQYKPSAGYTVPVISADHSLTNVRDRPVFSNTSDANRKRMDLLLDLGRQYSAENIAVKFDDRSKQLTIEAMKEERDSTGKVSRSQTQKQYELGEMIDPASIQAVMRNDGTLHLSALTCLR